MKLQTVLERIVAECPLVNKSGFLTDIKDIDVAATDTPAVFLFFGEESPLPNDGAGALTNQAVVADISMLVVAAVPSADSEPLADVRNQIFAALVGWESGDEQLHFSGGNAESFDAGLVRWRDSYQFVKYLRYTR